MGFGWLVEGGVYDLDHFVLQFIGVFKGVGGATCVEIVGICRVLALVFI